MLNYLFIYTFTVSTENAKIRTFVMTTVMFRFQVFIQIWNVLFLFSVATTATKKETCENNLITTACYQNQNKFLRVYS